MDNVGKKILTLCVVLALAVTAVLSFYHTIVAPPVEIPPVNSHQTKFMELVAHISNTSTSETNDSLVNALNDKLKLYKSEALMTPEENKIMVDGLISTYAPVFIEQSMNKFNQSAWYSKDHKQMEKMIKLMKSLNASVSTNAIEPYNQPLQNIKAIIRDYRGAMSLVNNIKFVSVSDANTKISKARNYRSMTPLNNCASLKKKLDNFPANMGVAHYNRVETRVNNLRNYRSIGRDEFNNNSNSVNAAISEYSNNKHNYGSSPKSEVTLRDAASSIYYQAQEYYNSGNRQSYNWSW